MKKKIPRDLPKNKQTHNINLMVHRFQQQRKKMREKEKKI